MKHLVVSALLFFSISLIAQKSPIDGLEFSAVFQNSNFNPGSYQSFYNSFSHPKELLHPDTINSFDKFKSTNTIGKVNKRLVLCSFFMDSVFLKKDSLKHRFDRLKLGFGAGRSSIQYYSATYQNAIFSDDSTYNYTVFSDLFRISADYQIFFRTNKRLQFYTGASVFSDIKIASILSKDGKRQDINDTDLKVILKHHLDAGLMIPLGLRFKLARNTYFQYEMRYGTECMIDHNKKVHMLFARGFNLSLSVDLN